MKITVLRCVAMQFSR